MKKKKNILFVIHRLPYPLTSGGKQAIFNGIDAVKNDFNVFVTYQELPAKDTVSNKQEYLSLMEGKVMLIPFVVVSADTNKQTADSKTLFQRLVLKMNRRLNPSNNCKKEINPYLHWQEELNPHSRAYLEHINRIIKEKDIDIVQCEMLSNIAVVLSLPSNVKTVFVHHELGFVRHSLELKYYESDVFDGQSYMESAKCQEIALLNKYNRIITLSSIDRQKLKEAGVNTPIDDSFAIVRSLSETNTEDYDFFRLTFVGSDGHDPNLIGIKWFLENCWSQLLGINSRFHLSIIGKWDNSNIQKILAVYPQVSFAGFVDNLESALRGSIMIVPITVGSGIRMKILEACGIGIPFVTTTIGAEGIPVINEMHCMIADTSTDFVKAIIRLGESDIRHRITINAKQMVEQYYSTSALRSNRLKVYQSLYEEE